MSDSQDNLQEDGRLILPILNKYIIIEAVYHKDNDLIFKALPRYRSPDWQSRLTRLAYEAGYMLSYVRDGESVLVIAKRVGPPKKKIPWVNILLFIVTIAFMILFYGRIDFDLNLLLNPEMIREGIIYALAVMPILLLHEFGHYIAGRKHKANVSLPYFIPAPTPFGTLGAIIKSKSPMRNRRQLFDVGAAGPLAGFVPAIIILIIGYSISTVVKIPDIPDNGYSVIFGESLIIRFIGWLFAPEVPEGYTLVLNPVLFAGWVGLFVTMINLMPFGQMDGGHIIYSMFSRKIQYNLALLMLGFILVLGYFWMGWFLWAFLALLVIRLKHPPTLDDSTELTGNRKILGWLAIVIFILTFIPIPLQVAAVP